MLFRLILLCPCVFFAVSGSDLADDPCRISCNQGICRYVADNHRTSCDHRVVADGHSAEDGHRTADPDIVPHRDRERVLPAVDAVLHIQRMTCRQNRDVRRDPDIVPEAAVIAIKHNKIVVGKKVFADLNVKTVIAFEWWKNVAVFAYLAKVSTKYAPAKQKTFSYSKGFLEGVTPEIKQMLQLTKENAEWFAWGGNHLNLEKIFNVNPATGKPFTPQNI